MRNENKGGFAHDRYQNGPELVSDNNACRCALRIDLLDPDRFAADSNGQEVRERIRLDVERAESLALEGTPTVFLNGTKVKLEKLAQLEQLVEAELKRTN